MLIRQKGAERTQLFDRLKASLENIKISLNVKDADKIQICFRAMEYPGEKDLVRELLQSAKEIA